MACTLYSTQQPKQPHKKLKRKWKHSHIEQERKKNERKKDRKNEMKKSNNSYGSDSGSWYNMKYLCCDSTLAPPFVFILFRSLNKSHCVQCTPIDPLSARMRHKNTATTAFAVWYGLWNWCCCCNCYCVLFNCDGSTAQCVRGAFRNYGFKHRNCNIIR